MNPSLSLKVWNAQEIRTEFPEAHELRDLIRLASDKARDQKKIVCAVGVNGMTLSEKDEDFYADCGIPEIFEFSITTQGLDELLVESRKGSLEYLNQLFASVDKAALLFKSQDLTSAHKFYRVCMDGVELFIEMMAHYKAAYTNTKKNSPFHSQTVEGCLVECLTEIFEAYKEKNYSLVAELLEYELSSRLSLWQTELAKPATLQDENVRESSKTECVATP